MRATDVSGTVVEMRHGIGLRAYGQRDPLNEYKREAFEMFEGMLSRLREQITIVLAHIEARLGPAPEQAAPPPPAPRRREFGPNPARKWRSPRMVAQRPCPMAIGPRHPATPPAPAARAGNSNTATAASNHGSEGVGWKGSSAP